MYGTKRKRGEEAEQSGKSQEIRGSEDSGQCQIGAKSKMIKKRSNPEESRILSETFGTAHADTPGSRMPAPKRV